MRKTITAIILVGAMVVLVISVVLKKPSIDASQALAYASLEQEIAAEQNVNPEVENDSSTFYNQSQNKTSYENVAVHLIAGNYLGNTTIDANDPSLAAFRVVINTFQQYYNLEPTGFVNQETLDLILEIPVYVPKPVEPVIPKVPVKKQVAEPVVEVEMQQVPLFVKEEPIEEVSIVIEPIPVKNKNKVEMAVLGFLGAIGVLGAIPGAAASTNQMITIVFFSRKKIRGVVYDSTNKEPLDPVYVSVIDIKTNTEIMNQFTDKAGRFGFVLNKGTYKIAVQKTHYQFPSVKLAGSVSDEIYDHLYFGEPFEVVDENHVVAMDIPMDKLDADWNQEEKHRTQFLSYLLNGQTKFGWIFNILFVLGFFASVLITYLNPVWWNFGMTALYIPIAFMQVYGHGWIKAGTITKNDVPLSGAVIRIYNINGFEILHKTTSEKGNYYILVPKGQYTMSIEQKNPDGSFAKIYMSKLFKVRSGIINKSFNIA